MTSTLPVTHAVAFSSGIRALKNIAHFLNVSSVVSPAAAFRDNLAVSCVVVWGRKQNARRALDYARKHQLAVRYVEDGWIRTCSRNAHSRISYSLLIDDTGVYYDSEQPSDLENFLNLPDVEFNARCDTEALNYARNCRERMVRHCITKYNYCATADARALRGDGRALVLVVDQTRDDASVRYGSMQAEDFTAMLDRALAENAGARVVVRTHPDVVLGKRSGYLSEYAAQLGVEISAEGDNPIHWLKRASKVYAGTSQLGYEALLCGCEVHVAGLPFYAGWGLTTDMQHLARRVQSRSLDQLFHATHIQLARYHDPVTGKQWQLHDCIDHVRVQQRSFKRNARRFACVGITPWKRRYVSQYLRSPDGSIRFCKPQDVSSDEQMLCWSFNGAGRSHGSCVANSPNGANGANGANAPNGAQGSHGLPDPGRNPADHRPVTRMEDGFIRSRGLGSNFVAPASLVIDHNGLYFDPSAPSDLENLLNNVQCTDDQIARAVSLRQLLLESRLTKYNVGQHITSDQWVKPLAGQTIVLVIGQVEDDQSILRGCSDIATNGALCEVVRNARPDAFVIYKPHPDVESGNRCGAVSKAILDKCVDHVERERHFLDCLDDSDELHTMTSLSGFEALLRGKPVWTYGMPFYASWGLTHDYLTCDRRVKQLTLDELVYQSLIQYPSYLDVGSGEFITVEQLIVQLSLHADFSPVLSGGLNQWLSKVVNIGNALQYNP